MRLLVSQFSRAPAVPLAPGASNPQFLALPPVELYHLVWRYYAGNSVYDDLTLALKELNQPSEEIRELRNPAHRAVEFHVAKLFPGTLPSALPILAPTNRHIIDPIHRIWRWSNFTATKQRHARFCGIFGDSFIKIAEVDRPEGRQVFKQVLDPRWVTDFQVDDFGVVEYIRIDVPQTERAYERGRFGMPGRHVTKHIAYTEIWDRTRLRIYRHPAGRMKDADDLGVPPETDEEHGLGFVPIVWAPFTDIGEGRGLGCYTAALSKIDEANRLATRLHALLFRNNNNNWVLRANQVDATGRPLPPPRLDGLNGTSTENTPVQIGDDKVWRLPGQSELQSIIPSIDYNAALAILNAQLEELRNDLPELRYYDATAKSHVSGTALRAALADAADRVLEVRGNVEGALARANAYALHIAQRAGIEGFAPERIGTLAAGDFEHQFADRPVFPLTSAEAAQAVTVWVQAGVPLPVALRQEGWTEDEVAEILRAQSAELARQHEMRQADAEAMVELPLTEEQISAVAAAYVKNVGLPANVVLKRLGWTDAEIKKLEQALDKAKEEAKADQDEQQQKALEMQAQQQAQAVKIQDKQQGQAFERQRQLQAEKLAAQQQQTEAKLAASAAQKAPGAPQAGAGGAATPKPPKTPQKPS